MEALATAANLFFSGDPELWQIIRVSLAVSISAVAIAAALGLPLGALIALNRFPGRGAIIVALNGMMGLPPVVVGLAVYLLLSRSGPLGALGLLFTPPAMVIAQAILVLPIIAALTRQIIEDLWTEYGEQLISLGVAPVGAIPTLLWDGRYGVLTAVLAGFGRAAAEVGAILIVGGNIAGVTRTMTTAIALETSRGDLALALALGVILITLVFLINAAAFVLTRLAGRAYG